MTKLRKRMILLKTDRLLKENELVLFYHDPNNGNGHNKTKVSSKLATKKFLQSCEPRIFAGCEPSFEAIGQRNVLQVKNKIGIRALHCIFFQFFQKIQPTLIHDQFRLFPANNAFKAYKDPNLNLLQSSVSPFQNKKNLSEGQTTASNLCEQPKVATQATSVALLATEVARRAKQSFASKGFTCKQNTYKAEVNLCKTEEKAHSTMNGSPDKVDALLQGGGTIIIGIKKLASIHQNTIDSVTGFACHIPEKIWSNDKNLLLMGGIYRAQLVNIKTLKRLWNLDGEKIYYQKLTTFLRQESLRIFLKYHPFQSIHKHTFCVFSCLQFKWILLIYILKNYNNPKEKQLHTVLQAS